MNIHRDVSLREGILLGLILIFAAYYFLLHKPLTEESAQLKTERSVVESEIAVLQSKLVQKSNMEKEIDELLKEFDGDPTQLPVYSNMDAVMTELHLILGDSISYSIQFQGETKDRPMVRVAIAITYKTETYDDAIEILRAIEDSRNCYLIRNLSVSTSAQGNSSNYVGNVCNVSLTMTEFEYEKFTD